MVATPGFEPLWSFGGGGEPAVVGMVLETFPGQTWFGGTCCSVFLVETFHVLPKVVVPMGAGAGRTRGLAVGPQPSTAALIGQVAAAVRGESVMPSPTDPGVGWGSKVLVRFLPGGVPYVDQSLPHPALATKRTPTLTAKTTAADLAQANALLYLASESDEVPDDLSDADAVTVPEPPARIARSKKQADEWRDGYRRGWMEGAEAAWEEGEETDPPGEIGDVADPEYAARDLGYEAGWPVGQREGLAKRAATPPVAIPSTPAPLDAAPTEEEPGDVEDDDHAAAVSTGDDVVWEHDGNRLIMRADGGFLFDTRAGGPIDLQASADGTRISAGGVVLLLTQGGVTIATDGAAEQETIRGTRLIEWLQTEASFQTAMGPSGPLSFPAPSDLKTDKVKVT